MSQTLYGRVARVVIDDIDITGLDVEFRVHKTLTPEPNTLELSVYNLNEEHRSKLQSQKLTSVRLEAGYRPPAFSEGADTPPRDNSVSGAPLPLIFGGDVRQVFSHQEGDRTWVTELRSGDGDKAKDKRVNLSFGPGTPLRFAIEQVASELGLGLGQLPIETKEAKFFDGGAQFPSGVVMSGNGFAQLTRLLTSVGYDWSVHDGEILIVKKGSSFGTAVLLTPETGLVGSPVPGSDGTVQATSLLQPDLIPGRQVQFDSRHVHGFYVVENADYIGRTFGQEWYVQLEAKPL